MWCLIVFIVLWSCRKKFKHDGDALLTYAALYGFERMFVERLRGDSLYLIKPGGEVFAQGIRVSEMLSFVVVVCVVAFFIIRGIREKKLGRLIWPSPEVLEEEEQSDDDAAEVCAEAVLEAEESIEEQPEEETQE